MNQKINELKSEILLTFLRTQNLIISSYFNKAIKKIKTLEEVENYRRKLYSFKDYLGVTDGYNFYNNYYSSKMEQLEEKYNALENGEIITALKVVTKKENKIISILKAIKKLIFGSSKEKVYTRDLFMRD